MKTQVKVWLKNDESSRTLHEIHGQKVECYIPARTQLVGVTDAKTDAVLSLLDLDESYAPAVRAALEHLGTEVFIYVDYYGDVGVDVYLIIEECKTHEII